MRPSSCSLSPPLLLLLLLRLQGSAAVNATLGCSGDNVTASAFMGVLGGVFVCILPCCGLCFRAKRKWAQYFLYAPAHKVGRVQAEVKEKWIELVKAGRDAAGLQSTIVSSIQ